MTIASHPHRDGAWQRGALLGSLPLPFPYADFRNSRFIQEVKGGNDEASPQEGASGRLENCLWPSGAISILMVTPKGNRSMKYKTISISILALLASLLTALPGKAAFLVGNLDLPDGAFGGFTLGEEFSGSVAGSFLTGAVPHTLDSIVIRLNATMGTPNSDLVVSLFEDDGSGQAPGALVGGLSGVPRPAAAGDYSYVNAVITLAAGTKYWVNLEAITSISSGLYVLEGTTDGAVDGASAPNWDKPLERTFDGTSYSTANGLIFGVNGTAVPEPSRLILLGGAFAAACWVRRRNDRD